MIKYIDGDLIKQSDEFDVIVQCANCFCTMGAGIAPQIKAKFPDAYAADCATTSGDKSKLGTISFSDATTPIVVNLYGQYGYSGIRHGEMDLDYDALRSALREMKNQFSGLLFGLPKIGSGLAGGDWDVIEAIIEEELEGERVIIVNYVPQ